MLAVGPSAIACLVILSNLFVVAFHVVIVLLPIISLVPHARALAGTGQLGLTNVRRGGTNNLSGDDIYSPKRRKGRGRPLPDVNSYRTNFRPTPADVPEMLVIVP